MSTPLPPDENSAAEGPEFRATPWWEIIVSTPIRDALRGDWSGRLSYKQILRTSALPIAIIERIIRILRKARLWRNERNDVTRELIAHFQEGLDRGVPAALLVDQFGDVKTTARLIRRAKLRKRPIWWKTWYGVSRSFVGLLAVLLVLYVVQAIRFISGRPVITHNYLKELNEEIGRIPIEDRAWPVYVEAMKDFPKWPQSIWEAAENGPASEDWPELVAFIKDNQSRISVIEKAADKPRLGWFVGESVESDGSDSKHINTLEYYDQSAASADSLISLPISPVSSYLLNAFHVLRMAFKVAVAEDDPQAAQKYLVIFVRIAEQLLNNQNYPLLINQLSGIAIFSGASRILNDLLVDSPDFFTLEQLDELSKIWSSFHAGELIRFSYEAEMMVHLDVLQRVYTPGPKGRLCSDGYSFVNGSIFAGRTPLRSERFEWRGPLLMSLAVNRETSTKETRSFVKESEDLLSVRPWVWNEESEQRLLSLEEKCNTIFPVLRNPMLLYEAAHRQLARNAERAEQSRTTTLVAIALTRFKRERGRWPDQLEQLVPTYLASVPLDPNDGQPIRYKLIDNRPLVYSVGSDRFDDGGVPSTYQIRSGECPSTFFTTPTAAKKVHDDLHH